MPKPCRCRGGENGVADELVRPVRSDERTEDRDRDQDQDEHGADAGAPQPQRRDSSTWNDRWRRGVDALGEGGR